MIAKILIVYLLFCKLYGIFVCPVLLVLLQICCFVSCSVCMLSLFSWYSCNIGDHIRSMHSYVFSNIGIIFLAYFWK